jgi:ribonuclease E
LMPVEAVAAPVLAPVAVSVATPVAAPVAAAIAAPLATPPAAPAHIEAFALPTDSLHALASSAGLQWINSDAEKIRVVHAAMAAEPKPVHVPRQPPVHQVVDDGPLVLVETRRDLSQQKLPFDLSSGD